MCTQICAMLHVYKKVQKSSEFCAYLNISTRLFLKEFTKFIYKEIYVHNTCILAIRENIETRENSEKLNKL